MFNLKKILKTTNYNLHQILLLCYQIFTVLIFPFQRAFITIYTTYLQNNRLPFRILPKSVKSLLIYVANIDLWILFFKRIKNSSNLYVIRKEHYSRTHRFWIVYFREEKKYFYELNIKNRLNPEIANFYYAIRQTHSSTHFINKNARYKLILFYFFNKLALNHYPIFYWRYIAVYNKYNYLNTAVNKSQHLRTVLFFIFINSLIKFEKKKLSFSKLTFNTFKGTTRSLYILSQYKSKFVYKQKLLVDAIFTIPEYKANFLYYTELIQHQNMLPINDKFTYKFYLNNVISVNVSKFLTNSSVILLHKISKLKITWYTKIHNSIVNPVKDNIIMYLRAAKHFNKGRYSRNRQLYRTGVYWCIWLNIVLVYGLHFYFYRVVFAFGYLWLPLAIMTLSVFGSRLYKYRFYEISIIIQEFKEFSNFIFYVILKINVWVKTRYHFIFNKYTVFFKNYSFIFSQYSNFQIKRAGSFINITVL